MKCPYCGSDFHHQDKLKIYDLRVSEKFDNGHYQIYEWICPACEKTILNLVKHYYRNFQDQFIQQLKPKGIVRKTLPDFIEDIYKQDYTEAVNVLSLSPKASAALSRRCLQLILREKGGFKEKDLADQIQSALDSWKLPSNISEGLDAVRNIWNFAAHPNKSKSTGVIVEVEPWEAEWSLDVVEDLFDFYFIWPETTRKKKEALNLKLTDMWKPPLA